jgi:hypothetical protein
MFSFFGAKFCLLQEQFLQQYLFINIPPLHKNIIYYIICKVKKISEVIWKN